MWALTASIEYVSGQPVAADRGYVNLDRFTVLEPHQLTDQQGTPVDRWVVRADQAVLLAGEYADRAAALRAIAVRTGGDSWAGA